MPRFAVADVGRYYDRHTPAFVAFGQRGSAGALHRAVWAPGVVSERQAFRYVEDRIVRIVQDLPASGGVPHIVDLGCGVGASLCYLAGRLPMRGTGITVSRVQARLAADRIRAAGCADRVRCIEGDYCDLPAGIGPADLAFAIESFVHGPDPAAFFEQCRRILRTAGLLLICDDFRRAAAGPLAAATIERFCRGWQVNSLLDAGELHALARAAGFEHEWTADLSPSLQIGRARDRAAAWLVSLLARLPLHGTRVGYLIGGTALQTCLANGWIGYDLALFRRRSA